MEQKVTRKPQVVASKNLKYFILNTEPNDPIKKIKFKQATSKSNTNFKIVIKTKSETTTAKLSALLISLSAKPLHKREKTENQIIDKQSLLLTTLQSNNPQKCELYVQGNLKLIMHALHVHKFISQAAYTAYTIHEKYAEKPIKLEKCLVFQKNLAAITEGDEYPLTTSALSN